MKQVVEERKARFNFYGMDRFHLPGTHPGERAKEFVQFSETVLVTLDDNGEQHDAQLHYGQSWYEKASDYARHLLEMWPDQSAIQVHECETPQSDDFVIER